MLNLLLKLSSYFLRIVTDLGLLIFWRLSYSEFTYLTTGLCVFRVANADDETESLLV